MKEDTSHATTHTPYLRKAYTTLIITVDFVFLGSSEEISGQINIYFILIYLFFQTQLHHPILTSPVVTY